MKEYYVYEYYIEETNEVFYVGKGNGNRLKTGRRNKFCEDMKKTHDWKSRIVKDHLTEEESFDLEISLIKHYKENTPYRITNVTNGGEGVSGYKMPDDVKAKISEKSKELWNNESFRDKQMHHRLFGIYQSDEFKNKISSVTTGNKNGNFDNRWSDEQKQNLGEKRKELGLAKGSLNPKSKMVLCIETGEFFEYIRLAVDKYNIKSESSISIALNKKHKTAKGLHFVDVSLNGIDYWKKKSNRIEYWLECLNVKSSFSPIICVETKEYYLSLASLLLNLNISKTNFLKLYLKTGKKYNNFTYVYAKEYMVAYDSDVIVKIM